jgi:hypothetical protein
MEQGFAPLLVGDDAREVERLCIKCWAESGGTGQRGLQLLQ